LKKIAHKARNYKITLLKKGLHHRAKFSSIYIYHIYTYTHTHIHTHTHTHTHIYIYIYITLKRIAEQRTG